MNSMVAWGKLKAGLNGDDKLRLGLIEHCIDVAAVALALIGVKTIRQRLERLALRRLSEVDVQRLCVFAFLHDVGKAGVGFQSKALEGDQRSRWLRAAQCGYEACGHVREFVAMLRDAELRRRFRDVFPFDAIRGWDPSLTLWFASCSHHGTPLASEAVSGRLREAWNKNAQYDPWDNLASLADVVQRLFPMAFGSDDAPMPDAPAFVHAFTGLVSLADWIGSNSESAYFPYDLASGSERWPVAVQRAQAVLRAMRIDCEALREDLRKRRPEFGALFGDEGASSEFEPTELQGAMSELTLSNVVAVEAETGSGKTEAALWRFKCLFEAGEVDSLAFVLPTRVSATQINDRVWKFIRRLFPDPSFRPNVVLAVPGYLRTDGVDAEGRLANFEVLWPDRDDEAKAHLRWAAENSKRYLAAACAVGTIDQVLLSGLRVRHAHLRGFSLMRSLLVVDEVHASDRYMSQILETVLKRHRSYVGHALLLSATLGVDTRNRLVGGSAISDETALSVKAAYPCISDANGSRGVASMSRSKVVEIEREGWIGQPDRIAQRAAEALHSGARVLVVRNTVAGVLAVQAELEKMLGSEHVGLFRCEGIVSPHHGRYAAPDRIVLDAAIEARFGKQAGSDPVVLCGSQTLEQSLDIDADYLITDLAPVDVLLQRIGRLHRHAGRMRPPTFTRPKVLVLTPEQRDLSEFLHHRRDRHGLGGHVYTDLLTIDATWEQLESRSEIVVPRDNRELVELCTDQARLAARAEAQGEDWFVHWQQLQGVRLGKEQQAYYARLDWTSDWEDAAFPDAEERIRTRLGEGALRVPLSTPWTSPFGARLTEVAVPAWMAAGLDPSEVAQERRRDEAVLEFGNGDAWYRYSRVGLERL